MDKLRKHWGIPWSVAVALMLIGIEQIGLPAWWYFFGSFVALTVTLILRFWPQQVLRYKVTQQAPVSTHHKILRFNIKRWSAMTVAEKAVVILSAYICYLFVVIASLVISESIIEYFFRILVAGIFAYGIGNLLLASFKKAFAVIRARLTG